VGDHAGILGAVVFYFIFILFPTLSVLLISDMVDFYGA
jgi:hypothetical protein